MFLYSTGVRQGLPITLILFSILTLDLPFGKRARNIYVEGRVATYSEDRSESKPQVSEENKSLFEGDIILTKKQRDELTNQRSKRDLTNQRVRRKITTNLSLRWKLPIHYTFDGSHNGWEKDLIRSAIKHWASLTCIRFVEVSFSTRFSEALIFTKGKGCYSSVGFVTENGHQHISIGPGCLYMGTIAHELGHVLGFWHEQARPDRDDYVTVLQENVSPDSSFNFKKFTWGEVMSYGVPYDVGSLMHYGPKFFSKNGRRTIETNDPRLQKVIGQRDGLSFADVKLANLAYCWDSCKTRNETLECQNDGYQDPRNCSVCRCPDGLGGKLCDTVAPSGDGCGGVLKAGHKEAFIQSPGYPDGYDRNLRCQWLIEAPPGYRIYFEFVEKFSLTEDEESDSCTNYIEVRYYNSLSLTGGRFCGKQKPRDTMISQRSQLLLLFRSQQAGGIGFKAKYHTEACGGCLTTELTEQKACVRTVTYPCLRKWRIRARAPCITWWGWVITDCGYTYKTLTREDTCSRTERYCCKHFQLKGETCKAISDIEGNNLPGYKATEENVVGPDVVPLGWNEWSGWSDCSKPCGGCGLRKRKRVCSDPVYCGGLEQQEQSESCNEETCPETVVEFCLEKYPVKRICNPWTLVVCTEYETRMKTCHKPCCEGYVQAEQRCIKSRR